MAAGEYVSVHSQADTEEAELSRERAELDTDTAAELRELAAIYSARGLERGLARQVAEQLTFEPNTWQRSRQLRALFFGHSCPILAR